jgi:hypothetical protein
MPLDGTPVDGWTRGFVKLRDKALQQHMRKFAGYVIKRISAKSGKVIRTPVPRLITVRPDHNGS